MLVKIEDEKKANADAKAGKRKRKVVPVTKEEKHREQYRKHQKGKSACRLGLCSVTKLSAYRAAR
jgi:hypothetical protein